MFVEEKVVSASEVTISLPESSAVTMVTLHDPPTPPTYMQHSRFNAHMQRWEVVEYKYFVTVLKYIFLVPVLYSTTYFSDDFLL